MGAIQLLKHPGYAAFLVVLAMVFTAACTHTAPVGADTGDRAVLNAVVTFDALYELAMAVGGDRVSVKNIMPPGAEAHHFEPGARDLELLNTADLFIICGLGFEPWADSAVNAAANSRLVVCDASRGVDPIELGNSGGEMREVYEGTAVRAQGSGGGGHEDHGDHEHHDHLNGSYDPHVWLSPACAVIMARNIRDAFIEADPDGADSYRRNFDEIALRLNELTDDYAEKFEPLENRTIVTGHAVFAYLCRDFGLAQNSVEGVFAEGEPSARALAELVDFCRGNNVRTILAEALASPLVAETLASEAGASVEMIYTMESAEDGLSYLDRMEHNLEVIYKSLVE